MNCAFTYTNLFVAPAYVSCSAGNVIFL
jgi:hypothetical protein